MTSIRTRAIAVVGTALGVWGLSAQGLLAAGPASMVSGTIASVDHQANEIKLKTGFFSSKKFVVEPDTRITDGQQALDLGQLQPGSLATIEYLQEGSTHVAQSITVKSGTALPANQAAAPGTGPPASGMAPSSQDDSPSAGNQLPDIGY